MDNGIVTFVAELSAALVVGFLGALVTIGMHREKVNHLEKDVAKHGEKIDKLRTDTDQLLEFKKQAQKFMDANIYKSNSPLSLTDYGQKLVDESGFKQIFDVEKDNLVHMLEQKLPTTQYDAQEQARALMDSLTNHAPFEPLKKYAFDHGADLGQILRAGAIMLRDYYFEKHPEIVNPNEKY